MLLTWLDRYRDIGLLILRIGVGISFLFHGVPKLQAGPEMWTGVGSAMGLFGITFGHTYWGLMAALAESVGGTLLILGFLFRYACFALTFTMIVAATYHINAGENASHPIEVGVLFFSLIFIGPGKYALDSYLARREPSIEPEAAPKM